MSAAESSREELLDALQAVLEALDIPNPATIGDEEIHREILAGRVRHAVVMLRSILKDHSGVAWSTEYLRGCLAEHPAEGYKTWNERAAELHAARESDGAR